LRTIDEKYGVVDIVFLVKFSKKRMSENFRCGRSQLRMEQFVRFGINSGVQPILLVIELDHSFVNRNVIR
jgi:hypothetical protein